MGVGRRLTREERFAIARERAAGARVSMLAARYEVSPRTIHYTLQNAKNRQSDGQARTTQINVRLTEGELRAFDAALVPYDIASRADAVRRLMSAASGVFVPDDQLADELRGLAASLGRVGSNVNQIARRLNEARARQEAPPYTKRSDQDIRALAGLIFDLADQVQDLAQRRRAALRLEVTAALREMAHASD